MSKVVFRVVAADGSIEIETPWATNVGDDLYRIENSLFYAYSVSWLDIVRAPYDSEEGRPVFESVVEKSGHRTVRIIFDPPVEEGNESDVMLKRIVELGCTYEGATRSYISIDIPPETDFEKVQSFLIAEQVNFEYVDPSYEEIHSNGANAT